MKPRFQRVPTGPYYSINSIQGQVNKMYKKSMALLVITLLIGSAITGITLVGAQVTDTSQITAQTMLNMLENSHDEIMSLFDEVTASGGTVSEDAQEAYNDALQLRTDAQEEYDLGEYEEAVKTATKAMNKYGKAAGKVYEDDVDETEDEKTENYLGLFVVYERRVERLVKLRLIAEDLTSQGIDVTDAEAILDEAEDLLDQMSTALDAGDFESAEDLLDEASDLLGDATGSLQSQSNEKKKEKTEKFIVQTKSLVQNLETKLLMVLNKYNVSQMDADAISAQFQEMKAKLDNLDLEDGEDLDDIIDDLKDVVKESRDVGENEDEVDEDIVKNLKELNKHESKLERYRERIEKLAQLGVDTMELEELLAGAEEALGDAAAGSDEEIEDLIDDADELLDDLDDLIDDVEDETEDETYDDSEDETEGTSDKGKGKGSDEDEPETGDTEDDFGEASFADVLAEVNYMLEAIQDKIDVLSEQGQDTAPLKERLTELKIQVEDAADIEDIDELEYAEDRVWDLLNDVRVRLGEDPEEHEEEEEHPDNDHPDDDGHPDDDDDHPDDDHPDDDDDHPDDDDDDHHDDGGH